MKIRSRVLFYLMFVLAVVIGASSLCFADNVGYGDYELDADGTAALVYWHAAAGETEVSVPETVEIDGVETTVTNITASAFAESPDIQTLHLPDTLVYADQQFLKGTNVASVNIPPQLGGVDILGESLVKEVTIDEGRDVLPGDLLYAIPEVDEYWDYKYNDDGGKYLSDIYGAGRDVLEQLHFNSDLKEIGAEAFCICGNLRSVDGLRDTEDIGEFAFAYCYSLESITFPCSYVAEGTFIGCSSLKDIEFLSDTIEAGVGCFMACSSIETFTPTVINPQRYSFAWSYITDPNGITISDDDVMEDAFHRCTAQSVTMLTDPARTTPVTIHAYAFYISSINSITLSPHVAVIEEMAFGSSDVTAINLDNVKTIGNDAFAYSALAGVIRVPVTVISNGIFYECKSIESIELFYLDGKQCPYTIGQAAFKSCSNLKSINLLEGLTTIGKDAFSGTGITSLVLPSTVTSIEDESFEETPDLKVIEFSRGVKNIADEAFRGSGIEKVIFPDTLETIGVFSFADCANLKELVFKGSIKKISPNAFKNSGLVEVNLPAVTDVIDFYAFGGCNKLTKVTMTSCGRLGSEVFADCIKLQEVTLPTGISSIPEKAFIGCRALGEIEIPNGVKKIEKDAFYNCTGLTELKLSDTVTRIDEHAFAICQQLQTIDFGDGLLSIGPSAFEYCNLSLTDIELPESLKVIEDCAFMYCDKLQNVTINSDAVSFGGGVFYSTKNKDFTVHKGDSFGTGSHSALMIRSNVYLLGSMTDNARVASTSLNDKVLGSLTGSAISHITVEEGISEIPANFYQNLSMDNKSLEIDFLGRAFKIGSKAFYNAGTAGFRMNFQAGPPLSIADDAFAVEDRDSAVLGFGVYEDESELWENIIHTDYGRRIRWGSAAGYSDGLSWSYSKRDKTLYVSSMGSEATEIPDYESAEQRPWAGLGDNSVGTIYIEGNISSIGANAFKNMIIAYGDVYLPSGVREIHQSAFECNATYLFITFTGNKPEIAEDAFAKWAPVICYYPKSDNTWSEVDTLTAEQGQDDNHNYGSFMTFWYKDKGFKIKRDTNSMMNDLSKFGDRNTYYLPTLTKSILAIDTIHVLDKAYKNFEGKDLTKEGVCFGLAATMVLHHNHSLNQVFSPHTVYYYLNTGEAYKNIVNFYYLMQYAPMSISSSVKVKSGCKDFSELRNKIVSEIDAGRTAALVYECKRSFIDTLQGKGNELDHILVCYDYCDADLGNGTEHIIKVYDCNNRYGVSYLRFSQNYDQFSYEIIHGYNRYNLQDIYEKLKVYTVTDFTFGPYGEISLPRNEDSIEETGKYMLNQSSIEVQEDEQPYDDSHMFIAVDDSKNFTIVNAEGKSLTCDGENFSGDMTVYRDESTPESDTVTLEVDASSYIELSSEDDASSFSAQFGKNAYSVDATGPVSIKMSSENGAEVFSDNNQANYRFAAVTEGNDENTIYTQIDCNASGNIACKLTEQGLVIDNSGNISSMHILTDASSELVERDLTAKELESIDSQLVINTGSQSGITTNVDEEEVPVAKPVKVSKITLSGISKKIAAGKTIKLTATVKPSNAANKSLKWSSSNTKVATVTQAGKVTIKKKTGGKTVTITATAKDGSKVKATYKITSMKSAVTKLTVKGAKKTLKAGKTMKLTAKVKAGKGANTKVKWTTSNKKYATVSSTGKVKALKAGKGKTVKITCMTTDGTNIKKVVKIKIK